jgi:hypothetical protein
VANSMAGPSSRLSSSSAARSSWSWGPSVLFMAGAALALVVSGTEAASSTMHRSPLAVPSMRGRSKYLVSSYRQKTDEIYLATREARDKAKLSLHSSGQWRWADDKSRSQQASAWPG